MKTQGKYHVDICNMIYNFRIVLTPVDDESGYDYGWCFQKEHYSLAEVVLIALQWDIWSEGEPDGFIKRVGGAERIIEREAE